jgi:hypothetical protein
MKTKFVHRAAIALGMLLAPTTFGALSANDLSWGTGKVNLTYSRMIVHLGPQWIDVEEEAELQVVPTWETGLPNWMVEGTLILPKGAAITGCMLWNNDTLLMGKLRGRSSAQAIFDSLVPPPVLAVGRDPLLVEQLSDSTYGLHLFPFAANGSRRLRLRYLVPRLPGDSGVSLKPLFANSVNGTLPAQFRLKIRGELAGATLVTAGLSWPVEPPSSELIDLDRNRAIQLKWPNKSGGLQRGVRGHIDSGAWKGDYVLYTGKVPDSILAKANLKSETVVLWKWIQPNSFVSSCYDYSTYSYTAKCLNAYGSLAIQQAGKIDEIATNLAGAGNKVGLLADLSLTDSVTKFPLADSGSIGFRRMRTWLASIDQNFLLSNIAASSGGSGTGTLDNVQASRLRQSFRTNIREAATFYSADSGILRHLLVVTVGPEAPSLYQEPFDTASLPKKVSISSSQLVQNGVWGYVGNAYQYILQAPKSGNWPGVDLPGVVRSRSGGAELRERNGVKLPMTRDSLAGRVSIKSASGTISRKIVVRNIPGIGMAATLNVHGIDVSKSVSWSLYDEKGSTLQTWDVVPEWIQVANDSVVPRLWAKSEAPLSPVFEDKPLAPIFGVIDPFYSLLATPSDTVGRNRQALLVDSGVPFLSSREIFARVGYGGEGTGIGDVSHRIAKTLKVRLDGSGLLRIDLEGLVATRVEVRDLQGRLLASWDKADLAGRKSLEWRLPGGTRGMLLVSARTATGMRSARIFAR